MAYCAKCGAVLSEGSAFCASCGQAALAAATSTSATIAPISAGAALTPNLAGALAYILGVFTGVLFLVLAPYKEDRFVRFHAMQSILYSVGCIVFAIVWNILWEMIGSVSGLLFAIAIPIRLLISLAMFLFWLFLMYQAYNQRKFQIPVIGAIAAKQAG